MNKTVSASVLIFALALSCSEDPNNDCCVEPKDSVVKFQAGKEYLIDHVYVLLNKDKNEVIGYPDKSIVNHSAFDYYKGYYLNMPEFGITTGYLSMTIEEFGMYCDTLSTSTMNQLLTEKDPFEEYYYDQNNYLHNRCPECHDKDTTWPAIDTAKFHRLVDNMELEEYLVRVK